MLLSSFRSLFSYSKKRTYNSSKPHNNMSEFIKITESAEEYLAKLYS